MSLTRIGSIGINTGIAFAGVTTIVTLNTANDALSIGATVNVGSGITLGASGDIFATGVSTVTTLKVGSGVTVSSDGDIFATGVCTATSFSGSGANLTGIDTDLVSDTSPQLGGNLDVNTKNIVFGDSSGATDDRLTFGAGTDLSIYHDGSRSVIAESGTGPLRLSTDEFQLMNVAQDETMIYAAQNLGVSLNYDSSTKLQTTSIGNQVTGQFVVPDGGNNTGNNNITFGSDNDCHVYHNGTDFYVVNTTGKLDLRAKAGEKSIVANPDGAVELYHDNSKKLDTDSEGISVTGTVKINNTSSVGDYNGGADDMLIGTHSGNHGITILSGTSNGGYIMFSDNNGGGVNAYRGQIEYAHSSDYMRFITDSTERLRITSSGHVQITSGNLEFANGAGIDFSNVPDGSRSIDSDGNKLDDYEEGTYTITALNDGGATLTSNRANYTKIGNTVRLSGSFTITATNGTNNNQARFSIPFASSISTYYVAHGNTVTNTTYSGDVLSATIENNGSYMLFNPNTGMAGRTWSQLGLNSRFDFDVVYRI